MKQMKNTPLSVAQYTVGVDDKVEELKKLLDVKINDVRVLGLYGMGGIGKTTLAKSLFNNLVVHFERRSFISNVRSEVNSRHGDDGGLVSLQNRVLGDLSSSGTGDPFNDVNGGVSAIKRALNGSKVLLILDDVDEVKQLDFLMGNREWFHNGSRVVITTRDRQVLPESYVDMFYEVRELEFSPAMELFCRHAMGRKEPGKDFSNLSKQIVEITGGLPLSLEVIGSFLSDKKNNKEWEYAVEKLKQNPHPGVQAVLKISYDALDKQEQCIFLDIACLFVQMEMERDDLVDILNGCNFNGGIAMSVLAAKCLIKITTRNVVWMHDQVRDMGRQIVQNESLTDYGRRSRLWDRDQILTVLMSNKVNIVGDIPGRPLRFLKFVHIALKSLKNLG